ncbi:MAG: thrombospondin N-terminal-like domain protein [Fibrobacteres bacterium]|nr:thrombospondin N-terminal-like domain protein [Fibrobacterota bacterium]
MGSFRIAINSIAFFVTIGSVIPKANTIVAPESLSIKATLSLKPVAFWDFNDSVGDTLRDISGNNHHGLIKGAKWVEGVEGAGLALDGRAWIEIPADSGLQTKSFTFSIWLKQSGNGFQAPLMEFQKPSAQAGVHLWANTNGWGNDLPGAFYGNLRPYDPKYPDLSSTSNDNLINTEGGCSQGGRWNHVVMTYDHVHGAIRIYVNGKLGASKTYAPFIPSTVGSLMLGMRSLTSWDNEQGLGLNGTLDDGAIFDRALSEAEVTALYGRPVLDPSGLHLGIKTHYAKASDTLWVPVYLSSEGKDSLSSLQFNLELDSTVAELLDVKPDTSLIHGWQLTNWKPLSKSRTALALAGTNRISGPEEGEIARLKIRILPTAKTGASTMLTLSDISADEGRVKAISNLPGKIFVLQHDLLLGDVSGDGQVDLTDALILMQYVVGQFGLPNSEYPNFTLATADVTGNGEITSYDAALVLQYGLGIIEDFPADRKIPAKRAAQTASMTLEGPIHMEGNLYHYRILAANMDGLIGGRVSLKMGHYVKGINRVTTGVTGARVAYYYDSQSETLQIGMVANRKIRAGSLVLAEWDAEYDAGAGQGEITLSSVSLNEGGLSVSGFENTGLQSPKRTAIPETASPFKLTLLGKNRIRVSLNGGNIVSITVLDAQGRKLLTRNPSKNVSTMEIGLDRIRGGLGVIMVMTDKGDIHSLLYPPFAP